MSERTDPGVLTGPRARSWLKRCARSPRTIHVSVFDNAAVYTGTLVSAHRTLTVDLHDAADPAPLNGTVCSLYVHLDGVGATFLAHTLAYQAPVNAHHRLTLAMPTSIATLQTRRTFRIPADDDTPVHVVAAGPDGVLEGTLADLSRMGLSFVVDEPGPAERGSPVQLQLSWPGGEARVPARIAQVDGDQCAVSFEAVDLAAAGIDDLVTWQQRRQLQRVRQG